MAELEITSPNARKLQARALEAEERRRMRAALKAKDRMSTQDILNLQREEANKRLGITHRTNEVSMSQAIKQGLKETK